jgi:uncharacterized alkaline shock family protein YloU
MTQDYPTAGPTQEPGAEYRERAKPVGPMDLPDPAAEPVVPLDPEPARGATRITETVVAKIVALAAAEIPGVHSLARGPEHPAGLLPIGPQHEAVPGVAVELGDGTVAVDLGLVTWYGRSITQVTEAVRRNVVGRVEGMTGLRVSEVDITVEDLHVGPDGKAGGA